jgi:hypothetical protein
VKREKNLEKMVNSEGDDGFLEREGEKILKFRERREKISVYIT